jgi:hypothetical protein
MRDRPALPFETRRILDLARGDRVAAAKAAEKLSLDEQLGLVCEAPVQRRSELLNLLPEPERLIPLLPEAELCFTIKAIGLETATWILEHATPEQVVASLDLDVWSGDAPARSNLDAWLDALAETGDSTCLRFIHAIDPELLVLYLKGRIAVIQKPDEAEGWQPPEGALTLDGQFHFVALGDNDDVAAIQRVLQLLFQRDYWTYFRLMQGVIWELDTESQEWARRWRSGRLEDLGFPSWEEAMSLYRYIAPADRASIDPNARPFDLGEWHLPVWIPSLPARGDSVHLIFRTLAELPAEERRAAFYAFVAIANQVAVADHMELSDSETTPKAVEKAAVWISKGLEYVATEKHLEAVEVVRCVPLSRLFRVGANLEPDAARA